MVEDAKEHCLVDYSCFIGLRNRVEGERNGKEREREKERKRESERGWGGVGVLLSSFMII